VIGLLCFIALYVIIAIIFRIVKLDTGYYNGPKNLKEPATIAIVTGGSSGVGKQTVLEFASDGATVFMCDRNDEKSAAVAEEYVKPQIMIIFIQFIVI